MCMFAARNYCRSSRVFSLLHRISCIVQVVLALIWVEPIAPMGFSANTFGASSVRIIEHAFLYRRTESPPPQYQQA
eukprot:TsM_000385900 transcript=TsM_000385900 gene=TsM_000385900